MAKTVLVRLVGVRQLNRGDVTLYNFSVVNDDNQAQPFVDLMNLAGYELGEDDGALSEEDTLLEALSKLEARIVVLET